MPEYQIILLPAADYFAWVEAAKPYAGRFGANQSASFTFDTAKQQAHGCRAGISHPLRSGTIRGVHAH